MRRIGSQGTTANSLRTAVNPALTDANRELAARAGKLDDLAPGRAARTLQ
jgi:hypothetical protein